MRGRECPIVNAVATIAVHPISTLADRLAAHRWYAPDRCDRRGRWPLSRQRRLLAANGSRRNLWRVRVCGNVP